MAERLSRKSPPPVAALCEVILAARFLNPDRLRAVPRNLLRGSCQPHRELVLALFHTLGPAAAEGEIRRLLERDDLTPALTSEMRNLLLAARLAPPTEPSRRSASAPIRPDPLPVFEAQVNELPAAPFIIDTGAARTLLSRQYMERHSLPLADGELEPDLPPARNRPPFSVCRVERFSFGEFSTGPLLASVAPMPPQLDVAGLLAPFSTLRGCWWELDFQKDRLLVYGGGEEKDVLLDHSLDHSLSHSRGEWKRASLYHDRGNVFTFAAIDDSYCGLFLVDTGAGGHILTPEFAARAGIRGDGEISTVDIQGRNQIMRGGMHTLSAGGSKAGEPVDFHIGVYPVDPRDAAPINCAGFIGMPWFRGRKILVPPDQQRMYFR